jgi:hypothetical protein
MTTFLGIPADNSISVTAAIIIVVPLIQRLTLDLITIEVDKKEVNHKLHTAISAVVMVACAAVIQMVDHTSWWKAVVLEWGVFFLLFDLVLNWLRGKRWDHTGEVSQVDGVWRQIGWLGQYFVKVWCFLVALCVYFTWGYIVG